MARRWMLVLMTVLATLPAGAVPVMDFQVLRNGAPIGHHRVEVEQQGAETRVRVSIALRVSLGFLTLYRYRHEAVEIWRDGRLESLDSRTDDDGDDLAVTVRRGAAGLDVSGPSGTFVAPPDTVPTSYWNPALVRDHPVLDTQVGKLLRLTRAPTGPGRWRLTGDLNLDIAYSPHGDWSGLSFTYKGGDFLYVPRAAAGEAS